MTGFLKFMAGVVVGGAAVALLTPTTGEDLRRRILDELKRRGLIKDTDVDEVVEMIAAEIQDKK
ncbi:MAG: YtxH domain-containing protein [Muribaculaceae bacterium]|nr:YtxH domain-containing protein [Muribaculaceae bacterium]